MRKQISLRRFAEIDTNKDGVLDRVELTAHALDLFMQMDLNKDRFLTEDEFKKAQEVETAKVRAIVQTLTPPARNPVPAAPAQPRPAPAPAAPQGLAPACRKARAKGNISTGPDSPDPPATTIPVVTPSGYSTVTLLARLRGWSTSVPLATAV